MRLQAVFAVFSCVGLSLYAADGRKNTLNFDQIEAMSIVAQERQIHDYKNQENIKNVVVKVDELLAQGVKPDQILVVLDVDGTLTNHSHPQEIVAALLPRDDSTKDVAALIEKGVLLVVSSAWSNFNETLSRLDKVGLGSLLGCHAGEGGAQDIELQSFTTEKVAGLMLATRNFSYYQKGRVVSARIVNNIPFFWEKALSPYIVYQKPSILAAIKKVLFADDSQQNIDSFKKDVSEYGLYPAADEFYYFSLTKIPKT